MGRKKYPVLDLKKIERFKKFDVDECAKISNDNFAYTLNELDKKNIDPILEKQIKNSIVIKLIALVDNYCKNIVADLIDNYHMNPIELFKNSEIHSPNVIPDKLEKFITPGRIVATNFNFQDPEEINFVISNLLRIDFFGSLRRFSWGFDYDVETKQQVEEDRKMWFPMFLQSIRLRHKIAHEHSEDIRIQLSELRYLSINVHRFMLYTHMIIIKEVAKPTFDIIKNDDPAKYKMLAQIQY